MLGNGDEFRKQREARARYLSLPYNSPTRRLMRQLEEHYGSLFQAENAASEANPGLFAQFLSGSGALIGAIGGMVFLGPAGALTGAIVGGTAGSIAGMVSSVRLRHLTPAEWNATAAVFGKSLPPREHILITDAKHPTTGVEYTVPASSIALMASIFSPPLFAYLLKNQNLFAGRILVNMGSGYGQPWQYIRLKPYPKPGQVLVHELVHVWQIYHSRFVPGFVCDALVTHAGGASYKATPGKQWREYGLEQQAYLVDEWYAASLEAALNAKKMKTPPKTGPQAATWDNLMPMAINDFVPDPRHPNYRYIRSNLLTGSNDANSVPIEVYAHQKLVQRINRPRFGISVHRYA